MNDTTRHDTTRHCKPSHTGEERFIHTNKKKRALDQYGYVVIKGDDLRVGIDEEINYESICNFWDDLPKDEYMNDNGSYRQRRFGRYEYNFETKELQWIRESQHFFQSKNINHLNGGLNRRLPPVDLNFANSILLNSLVNYCLDIIPVEDYRTRKLIINTHQFRVNTKESMVGLPTPEGIHRDGHYFVSQHLIKRKNVLGGVSGIYSNKNVPIEHKQLNWFLDSIIINDEVVKHDVSPLFPALQDQPGWRDMLIIDYNFV
nr:2OG-Fe dioxygenase family protein [Endozoicomonas sp. ISHI1]